MGLAGNVLINGDGRVDTTTFKEERAYSMARS
jgi:hypothetical protein